MTSENMVGQCFVRRVRSLTMLTFKPATRIIGIHMLLQFGLFVEALFAYQAGMTLSVMYLFLVSDKLIEPIAIFRAERAHEAFLIVVLLEMDQ